MAIDPLRQLRPVREEELARLGGSDASQSGAGPLAYDVYRIGDELVIAFDVPGAEASGINVSIEGRSLVVIVRRELTRGREVDVIEAGRQHGVFSQRLLLGERWDLDRLTAQTRHGVLFVRAPLVAQQVRRHVNVGEVGDSSAQSVSNGAAGEALPEDEPVSVHPAA
jgi:HSP20 family protein